MAKYSRRGLIFNFFAYLVCVAPGSLMEQSPKLLFILTVGLALITMLRGYFLFRFESIYPRAPAKWRNRYFVATLIGAVWWGFILASITVTLGMKSEATLLWIYTVIFFSTTAHAFAPYQKFLSYYQFFGQVPAAGAAIYLGTLEGFLYGSMMVGFYVVLTHQCRLISENYWERLEATYALAKKTLSIEEEKRDTRANVELNQEFIRYLFSDIDELLTKLEKDSSNASDLHDELTGLHGTVCDFKGVLSKELVLDESVFNIRHEIQHLVAEFIDDAEAKQIQIETNLSANLPMRLRGDAPRLAQIIRSLLTIILQDVEKCIVLVEVEFLREYETAGELYISISRSFDKSKKLFFNESAPQIPQGTLSLVVAKGLADLMNGSIELNESLDNEQRFRFNGKIDIAEQLGQLDFHKNTFAGKNILLVHNHPRIVDLKRQELDALGFNVYTETQYKRAYQTLVNSYKFQNPIESLLFYFEPDEKAVLQFCEMLVESPELKYTKKICASSRKQQELLMSSNFDEQLGFYYVDKPTGLFEVESICHQLFMDTEEELASNIRIKSLLFCTIKESLSSEITKDIAKVINNAEFAENEEEITKALGSLENKVNAVLIDCDKFENVTQVVKLIRDHEQQTRADAFLPIIGMSRKASLEDSAYELGLDDFVDLTNNTKKRLSNTLSYWSTLLETD